MSKAERFGVHDVANITLYNKLTGEAELYLDTLKMTNMENTAETVYATGGQGNNRLVGWDSGRTVTFAIQDALLNPKAISIQSGTELETKKEIVRNREVLTTVDSGTGTETLVTLARTPLATGIQIFKTEDGYGQGVKVDMTNATVTNNVIGFPTADLAEGELVIVYYKFETVQDASVITIDSNKFPAFYEIVGDMVWRNEQTGVDEMVQIYIPKAKISTAFTLTMQPDGDPSVFDFNVDVFKDGRDSEMVKMIRYTE